MKKILERHIARLRRAQQAPEELDDLRAQLFERLYPNSTATIRAVHQERIPPDAPDWFFEEQLRESGLWEMMERCYPSAQSQSQ